VVRHWQAKDAARALDATAPEQTLLYQLVVEHYLAA
jgi:hypothetical protein